MGSIPAYGRDRTISDSECDSELSVFIPDDPHHHAATLPRGEFDLAYSDIIGTGYDNPIVISDGKEATAAISHCDDAMIVMSDSDDHSIAISESGDHKERLQPVFQVQLPQLSADMTRQYTTIEDGTDDEQPGTVWEVQLPQLSSEYDSEYTWVADDSRSSTSLSSPMATLGDVLNPKPDALSRLQIHGIVAHEVDMLSGRIRVRIEVGVDEPPLRAWIEEEVVQQVRADLLYGYWDAHGGRAAATETEP